MGCSWICAEVGVIPLTKTIKLWRGWPTFPIVFVDGKLIGGYKELQAYLVDKKELIRRKNRFDLTVSLVAL